MGVVYWQPCPSLAQRPHTGCSLLHRTFLSLQLSQASRFPLPVFGLIVADGGRLGPFSFSESSGLLPGLFLDGPVDGIFPTFRSVHDNGSVLAAEALGDIEEARKEPVARGG